MGKVSYCGIDLTFDSRAGSAAKWIEKNLSQDILRSTLVARTRPGRSNALGFYLSPALPPKIKIGSLFYPVGMTRWAEYWGLVNKEQLSNIVSRLDSNYAGTFVMQTDDYNKIQTTLRMLPPKPLTQFDDSRVDELYILCLVDERFHYQGAGSGDASGSTWAGLMGDIATNMGISLSVNAVDSAYLKPDPNSQLYNARLNENGAMCLDVCAYNVGHVIYRSMLGAFYSTPVATATSNHTSNLNKTAVKQATKRAGARDNLTGLGDFKNYILPAKVKVCFTRQCDKKVEDKQLEQIPFPSNLGKGYTLEYSTGYGASGTAKVFHDTCRAYWTECPSASTPTNESTLQSLTNKIGADWVERVAGSYRQASTVYNDIIPFDPDGCVDCFEWHLSLQDCYTRLHPAALNLDTEEFCHFDQTSDDSIDSYDSQDSSDDGNCEYVSGIRLNSTASPCRLEAKFGCKGDYFPIDVV